MLGRIFLPLMALCLVVLVTFTAYRDGERRARGLDRGVGSLGSTPREFVAENAVKLGGKGVLGVGAGLGALCVWWMGASVRRDQLTKA